MAIHHFSAALNRTIVINENASSWILDATGEVVTVTNGFYVDAVYSGSTITVNGHVFVSPAAGDTQARGIYALGPKTTVTIGTQGDVVASVGVQLDGKGQSLVNRGVITASDDGVLAKTGAGVTITNNGLISGSNYALLLDAGKDRVINRGTLDGAVYLDAGNDTLDTRHGTVKGAIYGGSGNDTLIVSDARLTLLENNNDGMDTIKSTVSYTLTTSDVEALKLMGSADLSLTGYVDADRLFGNRGDNLLSGRAGNDRLAGGLGNDRLDGGMGKDVFLFDTALSARTNVDRLIGYSPADDTVALSHSVFTGLKGRGPLSAGQFYASTDGHAHDASDRILYETDTGRLIYDADGSGGKAGVVFAILDTHPALTEADFLIV